MLRTGLLAVLGCAFAVACSKSDPRATDTAPPAATRGGAEGARGGPGGAAPVQIQVAGGGGEAAANDASFNLTTEQAAPTAAGSETIARLVVKPGSGYKMNKDFPTKLTLDPPAGVTLSKSVLELSDAEKFDDHELTF
jgi:hypothetical protein